MKRGTVTGAAHDRHIRVLREADGIYLDFVRSVGRGAEYAVTDGSWNPANTDGRRLYDREAGEWATVGADGTDDESATGD